MLMDAEFDRYRKNAIVGSALLRDAILRSLGHVQPHVRQLKAPAFDLVRRKPGRPQGLTLSADPETVAKINAAIVGYARVNPEKFSRSRGPKYALLRQVAMYAVRHITRASYPQIGKTFGKDHSTVLHAVREVQKRIDAKEQRTIRLLRAAKRGARGA